MLEEWRWSGGGGGNVFGDRNGVCVCVFVCARARAHFKFFFRLIQVTQVSRWLNCACEALSRSAGHFRTTKNRYNVIHILTNSKSGIAES